MTAGTGALRALRSLVVALSLVVLTVTGYGWSAYRHLGRSLTTSDVLTPTRSPDGATDVLLVGLDSRTDAAGNPLPRQLFDALHVGPDQGELDTDTLILVRLPDDPAQPATAVSIPRDAYVAVPGYGTHKINSAYARAADATRTRLTAQGVTGPALEQQADQAGRRELITTVERLTGASVDHFAEVNLVGFADITQAVGGVPVCLNAPVRDSYSGAAFPAGPQTLQGPPALAFVRQRHGLPRGDLDRVVRQQAFLAGLAHGVLSAGTLADPARLSDLITTVGRYVVVDPGWDLLGFATRLRGLSGGALQFRTIPTGSIALRTPSDGDAVQVDPAAVRAFVTGLAGASAADPPAADPPDADTASRPAAPTTEAGSTGVTVDVRNATTRTGLAADVRDLLGRDGFAPGEVGPAPAATASHVVAPASDRAAAEQVAGLLGGLPVHTDARLPAGRVQVVLGRAYDGPTGPGAPRTGAGAAASGAAAGADGGAAAAGSTSPAAAPAITAAGVPCVN